MKKDDTNEDNNNGYDNYGDFLHALECFVPHITIEKLEEFKRVNKEFADKFLKSNLKNGKNDT